MTSVLEGCDCALCTASVSIPQNAPTSQTQVNDEPTKITPLPKVQLGIVTLMQAAGPVTSTVVYPFVNDLVRALNITQGDEKKTGYYVGAMESMFHAAEALTVLQWSNASETVGRRPVLLGGMLGLGLSVVGVGLSNNYWTLVISRCVQGAFSGNTSVTKSVVAEITDATNVGQAFSISSIALSVGSTLGPFIGGAFASPFQRWPELFGSVKIFQEYPYLLPCTLATLAPLSGLLFGSIGLKETLPSIIEQQKPIDVVKKLTHTEELGLPTSGSSLLPAIISQGYGAITTAVNPATSADPTKLPNLPISSALSPSELKPFRELLVAQVLITITNYAFLIFLDQSMLMLIPLMYSTPIHLGGLGLTPSTIGTILSIWGAINGSVQALCFARVRKYAGQRTCYMLGLLGLGIGLGVFPALTKFATWDGDRVGPWVLLGITLQLGAYTLSYMSSECIHVFIAASAPSDSSLNNTNKLAQLTTSGVRALASSVSPSLFSLSLKLRYDRGDLSGFLVYFILCTISVVALGWSIRLPKSLDGQGKSVEGRQVTE